MDKRVTGVHMTPIPVKATPTNPAIIYEIKIENPIQKRTKK